MLKVKPPAGYPPEPGRYLRGNDLSPVAVCVILDTFDFAVPSDLQELVMAGIDSGAALSGTLQTENIGLEKLLCNVTANPNIRYIVLCGRESPGHLPGEALLALHRNGVNAAKGIIGSQAPTPHVYDLPSEVIQRFREQIITVLDLLCLPGQSLTAAPGRDVSSVEKAVWSCFQEQPVSFQGYEVYDPGAYVGPALCHKVAAPMYGVCHMDQAKSRMASGFVLQKLLPQTDCGRCGRRTCLGFAIDLAKGKRRLNDCPALDEPERAAERQALLKLLE